MPLPTLIRDNAAKNFLKEVSGDMRIGEDAIDRLIALLTLLAQSVAQKASAKAQADDRTTVLETDISHAFEEQLLAGPGGGALVSPEAISASIGLISTDDLKTLINLLRAELKDKE